MTLDELAYHQRAMADRGCSADEIASFAETARQWLIARRCQLAVQRALFPPVAAIVNTPSEEAVAAPRVHEVATDGRINVTSDNSTRRYMQARLGLERASCLSATEARVGLAILSHFNHGSGRCDPGYDTLADEASTSSRSVRRAVKVMQQLGLFAILNHAGSHHQHAYRPNWDALIALAEVNAAKEGRIKPHSGAKRPNAPVKVAMGGRQTIEENKIPTVVGVRSVRARPDPRQREMLMPMPTGRAADAAAERRVMDDIEREGRRRPSFNVSGLTPAQWADVHAAERHRRGQGIELIHRMLAATGPPVAVSGG